MKIKDICKLPEKLEFVDLTENNCQQAQEDNLVARGYNDALDEISELPVEYELMDIGELVGMKLPYPATFVLASPPGTKPETYIETLSLESAKALCVKFIVPKQSQMDTWHICHSKTVRHYPMVLCSLCHDGIDFEVPKGLVELDYVELTNFIMRKTYLDTDESTELAKHICKHFGVKEKEG